MVREKKKKKRFCCSIFSHLQKIKKGSPNGKSLWETPFLPCQGCCSHRRHLTSMHVGSCSAAPTPSLAAAVGACHSRHASSTLSHAGARWTLLCANTCKQNKTSTQILARPGPAISLHWIIPTHFQKEKLKKATAFPGRARCKGNPIFCDSMGHQGWATEVEFNF